MTGGHRAAAFVLNRLAFVDCEASSLRQDSYPIEIGWCLADTGEVESHLVVPHADWIDWDPEAEAVHGISRRVLVDQGLPIDVIATRMRTMLNRRILYADSSSDQRWINRLFDAVGLPGLVLQPFDELLDEVVKSEVEEAGRSRLNDDRMIDEAYARARLTAPPTHRAGADARYLYEVLHQALASMPR